MIKISSFPEMEIWLYQKCPLVCCLSEKCCDHGKENQKRFCARRHNSRVYWQFHCHTSIQNNIGGDDIFLVPLS